MLNFLKNTKLLTILYSLESLKSQTTRAKSAKGGTNPELCGRKMTLSFKKPRYTSETITVYHNQPKVTSLESLTSSRFMSTYFSM